MLAINWIQVLLQAGAFYLVVFSLTVFVFRPVLKIVRERDARMTGDREEAKQLVKRAEDRIAEYEQRIYQAKSEAKDIKSQILNTAGQKEREILAAAREESSQAIAKARQKLQEEAKDLMPAMKQEAERIATVMASTVLGRGV